MVGSQSVRVAVNIRPLITRELVAGCSDCISVTPAEPQVQIGPHSFTFDHVYRAPSTIFADCVAPLVDAFFHGYNGTVLAYGQTGSGKTYLMGTNHTGQSTSGIIPEVMRSIFRHVEETKEIADYLIRVSFIEIFKEEVFDLLKTGYMNSNGKGVPIQIRETPNGGILLPGVTEAQVTSEEEMASYVLHGSVCRATGSTHMNSQSSRSHAILTISMVQKRIADGGGFSDVLSSKLNLVDLAGSESAKRTGASRMRMLEGIGTNKGLLALGNVISAMGDNKKRKEGGYVPYRDSKLTRLLQDSLGGNSKTVMIACVSPADTNVEETLNTLKYAHRARNIQNKAIVNRDPVTAEMQMTKNQIEQLQTEINDKGDSSEELQILKEKIASLERSKMDLEKQLQEHQVTIELLTKQATDAQFEKEKLQKIESARDGKPWEEIDCDLNKGPLDHSEEYDFTPTSEDYSDSTDEYSEDYSDSTDEGDSIEWQHSEEHDFTRDNEQEQQGADPQTRRRVPWSQIESDFLKEAVTGRQPSPGKPARRLPWKQILNQGSLVFSSHRTPADLKEKWRRIQKQAVFSGDAGSNSENLDRETKNQQRRRYAQKKRRLPVAWSESEIISLKKWVTIFDPKQAVKPLRRLPWQRILELGCSDFLINRTPTDLKDKWKRMRKHAGRAGQQFF